jgi:hypothetical protein
VSQEQFTFQRVIGSLSKGVQDVPEGCCEFVGARVYAGSVGRKCNLDKSYCAESVYADSTVYLTCFLRKRELAERKKEKV